MEYICNPSKLSIYVNKSKKTAAQIKAETGCIALVNGGIYDMATFKPCCHLKVLGEVLAKDQYSYYGLGWNDDIINDNGTVLVDMVINYVGYQNYICCVEMVRCGKPTIPMIYPSAMGGSRPRSAFGVFEDGRVWLFATKTNMTPEELREYAVSVGVQHAIMLDGGGSTQAISPNGTVTSTRKVHNYICVWEAEKNEDKPEDVLVINEPNYKWAYNPGKRSTAKYLVLHHAAGNGSAEAIHNYHLSKSWAGIAYHYYVRKDGSVYRGRPEDWKGGHTTGHSNDLGICFEGDFQKENIPDAQRIAGEKLVADILSRYPTLKVVGHKALGNTSCPGKYFKLNGTYPADGSQNVPEAPAEKPDTKIDTVREVQTWLNNTYHSGLTVDGLYGKLTKKALVKALQIELGFNQYDIDGIYGPNTNSAVKNLRKGNTGDLVKVLQALLVCQGQASAYVDGDFGSGTESAVKAVQRSYGLVADGIAGKKTFAAMCQ